MDGKLEYLEKCTRGAPPETYDLITNDARLTGLTTECDIYFHALAAHVG